MTKKINLIIGLSMIGIILLSACVPQKTSDAAAKKIVIVSILPQQYFVERIAGDLFEIKVMVDPGQSAENYEPTPEKMKMVSDSLAYFTIGFPFEKNWMDKFTAGNPELKIYDTIADSNCWQCRSITTKAKRCLKRKTMGVNWIHMYGFLHGL